MNFYKKSDKNLLFLYIKYDSINCYLKTFPNWIHLITIRRYIVFEYLLHQVRLDYSQRANKEESQIEICELSNR